MVQLLPTYVYYVKLIVKQFKIPNDQELFLKKIFIDFSRLLTYLPPFKSGHSKMYYRISIFFKI